MNRSLPFSCACHGAAVIFLSCIACGGKADMEGSASAAAMDPGPAQKDAPGAQAEAGQEETGAAQHGAAAAVAYDAAAVSDATPTSASPPPTASAHGSSPCPLSVDAFCSQPNFVCPRTWASANESYRSCMQGADKVIFTSSAPCMGYEIASTLLWDNVQTVFVYDAANGALVGVTTRTGTVSQGGIQTLCAIGPQWPSACESTPGSACISH